MGNPEKMVRQEKKKKKYEQELRDAWSTLRSLSKILNELDAVKKGNGIDSQLGLSRLSLLFTDPRGWHVLAGSMRRKEPPWKKLRYQSVQAVWDPECH